MPQNSIVVEHKQSDLFCCHRHQTSMQKSNFPKTHCPSRLKLGLINPEPKPKKQLPQPISVQGIRIVADKISTDPLVTNVTYKPQDRLPVPQHLRRPFVYVKQVHEKGWQRIPFHRQEWYGVLQMTTMHKRGKDDQKEPIDCKEQHREDFLPLFKSLKKSLNGRKQTIQQYLHAQSHRVSGLNHTQRGNQLVITLPELLSLFQPLKVDKEKWQSAWKSVYDQQRVERFQIPDKYLLIYGAIQRDQIQSRLQVISFRALLYNFKKYLSKDAPRDILNHNACKRCNLELRSLLEPFAKRYRMIQLNYNMLVPLQHSLIQTFPKSKASADFSQLIDIRNESMFQLRTLAKFLTPVLKKYMVDFHHLLEAFKNKLDTATSKVNFLLKLLDYLNQNYQLSDRQPSIIDSYQLADLISNCLHDPSERWTVIQVMKKFYYFLWQIKGEKTITFDGENNTPHFSSPIRFSTDQFKEFLHYYKVKKNDQLKTLTRVIKEVEVLVRDQISLIPAEHRKDTLQCSMVVQFLLQHVRHLIKNMESKWWLVREVLKDGPFSSQFQFQKKLKECSGHRQRVAVRKLISPDHLSQQKFQFYGVTSHSWEDQTRKRISKYKSALHSLEHRLGPVHKHSHQQLSKQPQDKSQRPQRKAQPKSQPISQQREAKQPLQNNFLQTSNLVQSDLEPIKGDECKSSPYQYPQEDFAINWSRPCSDCDSFSTALTSLDWIEQQAGQLLKGLEWAKR